MKRTGVALTALLLVGVWVAAQVPVVVGAPCPARRRPARRPPSNAAST
ncbi:hypothetical protein [Saccharothrix sp.]|nr:hypothetical protein [Saccharothrix sp.]